MVYESVVNECGVIVCSAQPKVNVGVAKRLVRGALWEQNPQKRPREEGAGQGEGSPSSKRPSK